MYRANAVRGFSLVEAVISLGVLSVAMIGFLQAMSGAVKVSNEEMAEGSIQTQTRELMESLVKDLDNATICYMADSSKTNLGAAITTNDTDNSNNSYLLLKYRELGVDHFTATTSLKNLGTPVYYTGDSAAYPGTGGSVAANSAPFPLLYGVNLNAGGFSNGSNGLCYELFFKRDLKEPLIKEADPSLAPPAPVAGVRYIFADLDGDGAYTSSFAKGYIERRLGNLSVGNPAQTQNSDVLEKVYPSEILIPWDSANSSPMNTVFFWDEDPGISGYGDNIYHTYLGNSTTHVPTSTFMPKKPTVGGYTDTNGNGQWDPLLRIEFRFLVETDDGRATRSTVRMKIARTKTYLRNQVKFP